MAYRLEYQPGVLRSLEKLPRKTQLRILERIESLKSNPRPPGSMKLIGENA
jgi:mRNA-degrading endonuclease RelE of RelBE toxin-antitoxin system